MTDFLKYHAAGFGCELLPILPPDAKMSEASKVAPNQRGKVPGLYYVSFDCWTGFPDFTTANITPSDLRKWGRWPAPNVGIRAKFFPCVDIDCSVAELVEAIRLVVFEHYGFAPSRGRDGSARILLPYRLRANAEPMPKLRITFKHPSTGDQVHAVEFLGDGQQYLIEGIHPSGQPYVWEGGVDLITTQAAGLTEVSHHDQTALVRALEELLPTLGCTEVRWGASGRDSSNEKPIDDTSLQTYSLSTVAEALECIPIAKLQAPYEEWIALTHAAKAASGGDEMFYAGVYLPWSLKFPGATEEYIRPKWDSVSSSTIGADYIVNKAREHGFAGGTDAYDQHPLEIAPEISENNSIPPAYSEMALAERFIDAHGDTIRWIEKSKGWMIKDAEGNWVLDESAAVKSVAIDFCKVESTMASRTAGFQTDAKRVASKACRDQVLGLAQNDRRVVRSALVFAPGEQVSDDVINLWTGFAVKAVPGDWSRMRQHLHDNICGGVDEYFDYYLKWMAYAVQHPERQGEVAIVLKGMKGVGKGIAVTYFGRLFGKHFIQSDSPEHIVGQFNGHLCDKSVLFADEAFYAGDKKHEGKLKSLITERSLTFENKFHMPFAGPNRLHVLISSNSDWVIPASGDERRFFVLEVSDEHRQDHDYFAALIEQMENGGMAAMLHDLLAVDLSRFNVRKVPNTDALTVQKLATLPDVDAWLLDVLREGEIPGPIPGPWIGEFQIETSLVYAHHAERIRMRRGRPCASIDSFGRRLATLLPSITRVQKRESAIKRYYVYRFPSLRDARAEFEKFLDAKLPWSEASDMPEIQDTANILA